LLLPRLSRGLPTVGLAFVCACAERTPIALTDPPVCVQLGSAVKLERVTSFDLVKGEHGIGYFRCKDGTAIETGAVITDGMSARVQALNDDATEYIAWEMGPHAHYLVAVHPSVFITVPLDADEDAAELALNDAAFRPRDVEPARYIVSSVLPDAERVRVFGPHLRTTTIELAPESHQNIGGVRIRRSGGSIRVDSPREGHFDETWSPWR